MIRVGAAGMLFHSAVLVFMAAPLLVVVLVAFTPNAYLSLPVTGPSLRWFRAILASPDFVDSFRISLGLGACSASLAAATMLPASLALGRYRFPGRDAVLGVLMAPLTMPGVVLGIALLRFLSSLDMQGSFAGLVLSHALLVAPYVLRMLLVAVAGLRQDIERAASSLGASRRTVFRRITLQQLLPGLAGGWLLAFITSFDELTVSLFVASPQATPLPVRLFSHMAENTDPLVASVSTAILLLTGMVFLAFDRLYGVGRLFSGERS